MPCRRREPVMGLNPLIGKKNSDASGLHVTREVSCLVIEVGMQAPLFSQAWSHYGRVSKVLHHVDES
eukprot:6754852-Pyramimonas_sp.AAC.1